MGQGRTMEHSTNTLKLDGTLELDGVQSGSSVVLATMGAGILRQQTYAVQYEDDQAGLVQVGALDRSRGHR